uniref:C-type lectin domain-containing protein n=1 Tax=Anabas testudineus TaxID=64144 RepID=A0A3Q1I023_ANATE
MSLWLTYMGLCFLPACFPHIYILLEEAMSWAEAQSYCRAVYTDLATVSSEDESNKLLAVQKNYNDSVWIGLYDDTNSWRWSLQNEGFYGGQFSMWNGGEPNNYGGLEDCVEMRNYGWNDGYSHTCKDNLFYVCYAGESFEKHMLCICYIV